MNAFLCVALQSHCVIMCLGDLCDLNVKVTKFEPGDGDKNEMNQMDVIIFYRS